MGENVNKSEGISASADVDRVPSSVPGSPAELGTAIASEVGQRIVEVRGAMKQSNFAVEIGVHSNTLGRYERGERLPDAEFLVAISTKRNVSSDWLLFGRLPQRISRDAGEPAEYKEARAHSELLARQLNAKYSDADLVFVKQYGVEVGGGRGVVVDYERVVAVRAFSASWLRDEFDATENDLFIVTVRGDSMAGVVNHGDIVLVDKRDTTDIAEDVYIVRYDGMPYVKNLQRLPGGKIKVWSVNELVAEPFTIDEDQIGQGTDFEVLGRVLWRGGKIRR